LDFLVLSLIFLVKSRLQDQGADIKLIIDVVNKNPSIHTVTALKNSIFQNTRHIADTGIPDARYSAREGIV
jgi:hypothetical protein